MLIWVMMMMTMLRIMILTHTSRKPCIPWEEQRREKHPLSSFLREPGTQAHPRSNQRQAWRIPEFQFVNSIFELPVVVKTPFQFFKKFFTDKMVEHIAYTNLYSAHVLGDPNPEYNEDFLAVRLQFLLFALPNHGWLLAPRVVFLSENWYHAEENIPAVTPVHLLQ